MTVEANETAQINTETVTEEAAKTSETTESTDDAQTLIGGSSEDEKIESEVIPEAEKVEAKTEEYKELDMAAFKMPEGVAFDESFAEDFKGIAKELNLDQDKAQKLVDLQTKYNESHAAKVDANFKSQVKTWGEETKAELGANYKQELVKVAKAINTFGTPELRTLLNDTGLGNHKEVVKFFLNVGAKVSEDKMRDPNVSGRDKQSKSVGQRLYTNSKME